MPVTMGALSASVMRAPASAARNQASGTPMAKATSPIQWARERLGSSALTVVPSKMASSREAGRTDSSGSSASSSASSGAERASSSASSTEDSSERRVGAMTPVSSMPGWARTGSGSRSSGECQ